jgi:hypothetical protein
MLLACEESPCWTQGTWLHLEAVEVVGVFGRDGELVEKLITLLVAIL